MNIYEMTLEDFIEYLSSLEENEAKAILKELGAL